MKRLLVIVAAALLAAQVQAKVMDRILVKVNNEIILESEVDESADLLATQLKMAEKAVDKKELRSKILENLIEQKLIITMAEKEQVVVSPEAISDKVNEFIDSLRNKFPNEEAFEEALDKEGMSYTDFRYKIEAQVRDNLIFTKVKQKKQQEFISKAAVGESELKKYYDENKADFKIDDEVNIAQIFIQAGSKNMAYAEGLKKKAAAGEDFLKLAAAASEEDGVSGGDLGWIDTTQMDRKIRQALRNPKKGKIIGPIQTQGGIHIIKIEDYKKGKTQPLDEVKDKVRIKIIEGKVDTLWEEYIKSVKESAYIEKMK